MLVAKANAILTTCAIETLDNEIAQRVTCLPLTKIFKDRNVTKKPNNRNCWHQVDLVAAQIQHVEARAEPNIRRTRSRSVQRYFEHRFILEKTNFKGHAPGIQSLTTR